jgi:CspA family cold shock protein
MAQGTVKWFDAEKGYGFIAPEDGTEDVFVHKSNVEGMSYGEGLDDGEDVEYDVEETDKGLSAINVQRSGAAGSAGTF